MSFSKDESRLVRCFELARKGFGSVEPNPAVGCVIVHENKIIAEGWHRSFGGPHAEIEALQQLHFQAPENSVLYVNLEPCCHQGKTGPCVDAIIKAGLKKVVACMADPNPEVSGKGFQKLRDAGIEVVSGLLEQEAQNLNAPFVKWMTTRLPWVTAKWAMSLDGKIAAAGGESKWISSEASRDLAHQLRAENDCVIVGRKTIAADDPQLTVRRVKGRQPARLVLDSQARTSPESHFVKQAGTLRSIVACTDLAPSANIKALKDAGCEIIQLREKNGLVDIGNLLKELGRLKFSRVLLEGGAETLGSAKDQNLIDEVAVFIAPKLIGGGKALPPMTGFGVSSPNEATALDILDTRILDGDIFLRAKIRK